MSILGDFNDTFEGINPNILLDAFIDADFVFATEAAETCRPATLADRPHRAVARLAEHGLPTASMAAATSYDPHAAWSDCSAATAIRKTSVTIDQSGSTSRFLADGS